MRFLSSVLVVLAALLGAPSTSHAESAPPLAWTSLDAAHSATLERSAPAHSSHHAVGERVENEETEAKRGTARALRCALVLALAVDTARRAPRRHDGAPKSEHPRFRDAPCAPRGPPCFF